MLSDAAANAARHAIWTTKAFMTPKACQRTPATLVPARPAVEPQCRFAATRNHFTDAADDVVTVRVYEGIHYRFSDFEARQQGESVAKWVFKYFLRPFQADDDDEDDQ